MTNISGTTRLLSVIGHPIHHSLSPVIHSRFAAECGVNLVCLAFEVKPHELRGFTAAAGLLSMVGFSVTMPLKEAVIPYLDDLDDSAKVYSSVNTVAIRDGKLRGYNTDAHGFITPLGSIGFTADRGTALILGTGGAARTSAAALLDCGMDVKMASRRHNELTPFRDGVSYCAWDDIEQHAKSARILVNATPLGMTGSAHDYTDFGFLDALPKASPVYDLIYVPSQTALLKQAKAKGHPTLNGLSFLIHQAARSFYIYTGKAPSEKVIKALHHELTV